MNVKEQLKSDAHAYSVALNQVREARLKRDFAATCLEAAMVTLGRCSEALAGHVGRNIPRRATTVADGIVVIVEHNSDSPAHPMIHTFTPEGEEIRA